jgi:hypothetical protein
MSIDLDQASMEIELRLGGNSNMDAAEAIYEKGGFSRSYATVTLLSVAGLSKPVAEGTQVIGQSESGVDIYGLTMRDLGIGEIKIPIRYNDQILAADRSTCNVGALPIVGIQVTYGCFRSQGSIVIGLSGGSYSYEYNVLEDNDNERTLQSLSTDAEEDMLVCDTCPHRTFTKFFNYYKVPDYADRWVTAAFQKTQTRLYRGNADFADFGREGRAGAIKIGSAFLNVWMYVIRQMEAALDSCSNAYVDIYSWDQAVAIFVGSLEVQNVTQSSEASGQLVYALANALCKEFKTCGENGNEIEGESIVAQKIMELFIEGQEYLANNACDVVAKSKVAIEDLMAVPIIQALLYHAYNRANVKDTKYSEGKGAAYAAAVLPLVHDCSPDDAALIYENMKVGSIYPDFSQVKRALERNYNCMGISCSFVGGYYNADAGRYYDGAAPCRHTEASDGSSSNNAKIGLGITFGLVVPLLLVASAWYIHRQRKVREDREAEKPLTYITNKWYV